jgi:hypothetical protein
VEDHQSLQLQGTLLASQLAANAIRLKLEELVPDRTINPPSAYARWSVIGCLLLGPGSKHRGNRLYVLWQLAEFLCDLLKKEISTEEKASTRTRRASRSKQGRTETDRNSAH